MCIDWWVDKRILDRLMGECNFSMCMHCLKWKASTAYWLKTVVLDVQNTENKTIKRIHIFSIFCQTWEMPLKPVVFILAVIIMQIFLVCPKKKGKKAANPLWIKCTIYLFIYTFPSIVILQKLHRTLLIT